MSVRSLLIIALVATVVTHNVAEDVVKPDENTEVDTGDYLDYASTYPKSTSQTSRQRNAKPKSRISRSVSECSNYKTLSSAYHAQGAMMHDYNLQVCRSTGIPSTGWYRFSKDAGNEMPTSCVPIFRCGAAEPGWMNGDHPTNKGITVQRQVCLNQEGNCCKKTIDIRVRNCGQFYIYHLPKPAFCGEGYCGNALAPLRKTLECGGNLTSLSGQVTSPGYPDYMEPISCHWTIKAPFDGNILTCFEKLTMSHKGCSSNIITLDTNGREETFCRKQQTHLCRFGNESVSIRYQSTDWTMKAGFKLRYAMVNGSLENVVEQSSWNIPVKHIGVSAIQVSWRAFNDPDANKYVYGYVVVCRPANQRPVYVLTEPSAATITIDGLSGGTEYKVQVVALVNDRNAMSPSLYGSVIVKTSTDKGECTNYYNWTSGDRLHCAPGGSSCDKWIDTTAWYRFSEKAGTQIATSCVSYHRCGAHITGWMLGTHPAVQDGIVNRTICLHWLGDCCRMQNTVRVRNCGGFYVYMFQRVPFCWSRYCGNIVGCGKSFTDTNGTLTSPGYPYCINMNSKCQWTFTAPSPSGAIVVIVEHLSTPISARCRELQLALEDGDGREVGKACGDRRFITWVSEGSAKLKFHSSRATRVGTGFKARYFIFESNLTDIPELLQWPGMSTQPMNSTALTVRWGTYPSPPANPSATEYLIICVPDGLPLNATVFITDVSKSSINVTGLMKYTNYTVQIVVRNSRNNFQYLGSQKILEKTFEDVPSEGPSHISAIAKGNPIMVKWHPIPIHARNGIITGYVIYYKKAWTSDRWTEMNVNTTTDKSQPMTEYLKGLEPATEYHIQMAGVTRVGVGAKSKSVLATSGCNYEPKIATGNQFSWTFTSPRYPGNYLRNLNCTWPIESKNLDVYVVFDSFHVEEGNPCPDQVVMKRAGNITSAYCGKKNPFAVKLSSEAGFVQLKTDGGLEERGFRARVFAVTNTLDVQYARKIGENNATLNISLGKYKGTFLECLVLYGKGSRNETVWDATNTTTNKAVLTGLDVGEEYRAFILVHTTKGVYRGFPEVEINLKIPTSAPTTEQPERTEAPKVNDNLGMYPYDESVGDSLIPNTEYYSTHCLRIGIPDGIQFFQKRHHKIHICRNGLLLFETDHLINCSRKFIERDSPYSKTAIIAPYWAFIDVNDAFVNVSKVFYQVYENSNNRIHRTILKQATYDVNAFHLDSLYKDKERDKQPKHFEAKWVLVVTWVNLRPPNVHNWPLSLNNTFQVVLITDSVFSFVMFNYPPNGIQWSAPTPERKNYKYFTYYPRLPVVGLNGGVKKHEYYHVQGSGQIGIVYISSITGKTIRTAEKGDEKDVYEKDLKRPGKWLFRIETAVPSDTPRRCKRWFKSQPDHRHFTEHLEPCPCSYRQASLDERFRMEPYGWPFICAHSVFGSIDGWNQECCYDKVLGTLVRGHPGGGFPFSPNNLPSSIDNYDKTAFTYCCVSSNQCKMFYEKRPSDNCSRYKPTQWGLMLGDPHFVTLDGLNYTFNGLGEYIMTDISDGMFQLQARTQLVEGGGKATVFVAAVAKQTGSSAVQVNLKPSQGLEVLVNGTVIDHSTLTNTSTLYNGSIALSRPDSNSITVLFPTGISVKITNVKDSLAIVLAAPEKFKNKTRGLLGVWNDNPEDDLTTPTGRVLPVDAKGKSIHYDFGQKWQVTEDTSLFTYKQGESVHTFSNSSFEPMFIDDFKFANDTVEQEALEKCEGDFNCLYDAALTNDVTMGTSTKIMGSRIKNESEAIRNSVPMFLNDSSIFYVTVNTTARIEIFAKEADGDPLTFHVSGILPKNLAADTDSGRSVVISWKVTMDKIKFEITVMDDKGAAALLRPEVHLCACHNGGYCSPDSNNVFADSTNDTFVIMPCTCIHGYTGRFCENDLDACQANFNPCYPGVECTDLPPPQGISGYKCGPCPSGFTGDGAICLDLDECQKINHGCSQVCVNTPGSFVCDCNQGYRLSIDQKTCNDIDECFPSSDCMQKCRNTAGYYTCECDDGFKVDAENPKKCVPKLPCTSGNHGCQHICYTKDGQQHCACHQGYELMDDQKTCKDIDECTTRKYRCNQYCHNTEGSYSCSCKKRFRMDSDGVTCVDVDECMELTYQCPDPSQICLNTAGSYKCVCGPGLYLTVNNTCREIPPGATPPSPGPAPTPKPPTDDEKNNAVRITVQELHPSEWNEQLDKKFKQSVAKAVTSFCASKDEECKRDRKRERRALDYILYTADQIHLLPGFPKQINLKSRVLAVVVFYVEFPPEMVSTSGDSIKGGILTEVMRSYQKDIEKALNRTIINISLNKKEETSTKKKTEKLNINVIIGGLLGGVVFIVIAGFFIRRKMTHNATFRIKRKQEKEERKKRATDVNNACYDEWTPDDFRLGSVQSPTDILQETGKKIPEFGIENVGVDVK